MKSPCIGVCELDHEGVCLGCGRSGEEITVWRDASDEARLAIIDLAAQRLRRLRQTQGT
ncbi:MAG: DUF1289 domain-containing protein [Pseudomonadota bacterium]